MRQNNMEDYKIIAIGLAFFFIILMLVSFIINIWLPFKRERDYIKMEIQRSKNKKERLWWEKELKMFYISKIPIINSIILKKMRDK